mmetsp:Transcript_20599/g.54945  ORF Transcript_20599/g.54945 Transcript_20599/m.54945 type:complete len:487 (-) Transcript_20599:216-1676(-)
MEKLVAILKQVPGVGELWPYWAGSEHNRIPWISQQILYDAEVRDGRRDAHLAASWWFNTIVCILTLLCSIMLGIELDHSRGGALSDRLGYFFMDIFFAGFFLGEFILRVHQMGWDYFLDLWNIFDYSLVVVNVSDIIISTRSVEGGFQMAATLRVIRLLRIARYVQGIRMFDGMWMLIEGLLTSLKTMVWTGLLLVILLYCISIILMTLVADEPLIIDRWLEMPIYVGSLYRTLITVSQVFTLDAWASDIVRPTIMIGSPAPAIVLVVTIFVCNLGVLNIVISLMVERIGCLKRASELKNGRILQRVEDHIMSSMCSDFANADLDENGELDIAEFQKLIKKDLVSYKMRLLGIAQDEAETFFELMDVDRSGSVSPEEFVEGLQRLRGPAKGQDVMMLISFAHRQARNARESVRKIQYLNERADVMQERLDVMGATIELESGARDRTHRRTMQVWRRASDRQGVLKKLDKDRRISYPSLNETAGEGL